VPYQFGEKIVGPIHDDEMMTPLETDERLRGRGDLRKVFFG
jgi:hypothetical protein